MPDRIKQKLIDDFEIMKGIEVSAHQLYLKAAADEHVIDEQAKNVFLKIAGDEERHIQLVQQILDIIKKQL